MNTGLVRTDDHRYYWQGQGPFPGVTTVQGVLDKPALVNWAKKEVAACAMRHADDIAAAVASGDAAQIESTRKYLSTFPDRVRDIAADLGTAVHFAAEQLGSGISPDLSLDVLPFIEQYLAWRSDWEPEYLAVEYQGINLTHRYGGTGDLIVRVGGESWLLDIKTGKYFDDTALQLVACAEFEFIGYPDDPEPYAVPLVDRFGVLDLKPDGWKVVPYVFDRAATFAAFTNAAALWHWKQSLKRVRRDPYEGSARLTEEATA